MSSPAIIPSALTNPPQFADLVLGWYDPARRNLPWQGSADPYAIWIAEVMLQQTTVNFAATRFQKWIDHFPTLASLANAEEREVLSEWEGLGYYSRARNLHAAAKQVTIRFGGKLPDDYAKLTSLPGIGDYTANAILAIAYNQPTPALDVNLRRILSRVLPEKADPKARLAETKEFLVTALENSKPRYLTEALMELGQTICKVRAPVCTACPVESICQSTGMKAEELHAVTKAKSINRRSEIAVVAIWNGAVLLNSAPEKLFKGMHMLPTFGGVEFWEQTIESWRISLGLEIASLKAFTPINHHYTTNIVKLFPIAVEVIGMNCQIPKGTEWIEENRLAAIPMPSAHRKILKQVKDNFIVFSSR